MIKYLISFFVLILIITIFIVCRLSEFDLSEYKQQRTISLKYYQNVLEGTLIIPSNKKYPPVVILIHGDGAQDRWSDGGYMPLVKYLVSHGIAVFSWDKPGVGSSTGNWLSQTMSDRADEASFILQKLRKFPALKESQIGYLGFSQAGWVIPKAIQSSSPDFSVLIGAGISWKNQGMFYMEQRLKSEQYSVVDIESMIKQESTDFDLEFTQESTSLPCLLICDREDFERRNALSDATKDIAQINKPILLLMGAEDRNVDTDESIAVYSKMLPTETRQCIKTISNATHGLLRAEWFNYQLSLQWPFWKQWLFLILGQYAYAPNSLDTISDWIINQKCSS